LLKKIDLKADIKANGTVFCDSKTTLFTVEDNGIGINPEKADKLFQKFYQIDTGPTRKHAGTGLGLVICRGIIEAHGGNIWLDKTYRNGATIKFTLPQRGQHDGE
jgi:signal transduction histidine kinase